MCFLLFAVGNIVKAFSMSGEVEVLSLRTDAVEYVDMTNSYHQLVALKVSGNYIQSQGANTVRIKRTVSLHITNLFKNLHRNLSRLDSVFAQNDIRVYHTINSPYSESFGKYYYVFTLRHIII